ncbi:hypothetical protein [Actinorugispora endophytica]|uniref:Uncharacterized protein n=1 Tax=Actinorugispora endophytica TaxID=1605990 RepID=A0A4R6V3Y3_9ACTN|nr:hypothetical protein [Actinorugispora endophytica]TDQ53325.1 hypothetical protein EV190_104114 [Actinorugispora endophytica]
MTEHTRETRDPRTDAHTRGREHTVRTVTGDEARAAAPAPRREAATGAGAGTREQRPAGDDRFDARWRDIQSGFVDDPRASVAAADALVGQGIERLTGRLNERRREVEAEWQKEGGNGNDTERLRVALREYRSLLEQMSALK